ncbi:Large subunit GTPase 1-like [Acipenser ruthenus]|uniref:Large subunit GTPase 1-like n=1 Tax=Acipenser ruthenus TaxID=7906 RepID=A0A662YVR3_ACIRT|nr:Large subunit GTPase 1-like [Acipenser ruthenus]
MGKKKSGAGGSTGLGRALIKERQLAGRSHKKTGSWLHTCELNDGYDWGRLNLQSVTEQNSLDEFLATAELAGTEFVAEKLNIKFVPAEARSGLLTAEESQRIKELHEENKHFLRIPRRPYWDENTSTEVLQHAERDSFLLWRRQLVLLEEQQTLILTPFERNLDFWRQLWRVIERSDVVVQILDARNPLLFRSLDLECYVKEVSQDKENMLLLNKADLLTREQRRVWARHFEKEGVRAVFWSALAEGMRLDAEEKGEELEGITEEQSDCEGEDDEDGDSENHNQSKRSRARLEKAEQSGSVAAGLEGSPAAPEEDEDDEAFEDCVEEGDWQTCSEDQDSESTESMEEASSAARPCKKALRNSSRLLKKEELLEIFKAIHTGPRIKEGQITVGLHCRRRPRDLMLCFLCLFRLEEQQTLILTPFERNLDFWRQLWRVIERSDVVVQILDARNPLLFRSLDLECYVKEVSQDKENMLLLNKADLLTREQRRVWARHFEKEGVRAVFWSALAEGMRLDAEEKGEELEGITEEQSDCEGEDDEDGDSENHNQSKRSRARLEKAEQSGSVAAGLEGSPAAPEEDEDDEAFEDCVEEGDWQTCSEDQDSESTESMEEASSAARPCKKALRNSSRLLKKEELLEIFKAIHTGPRVKEGQITVGLHIPRHVLEATYGINIIRPREDEDPDRTPTAEEFLTAYGYMRGFMTAHGQPDQPRSARYILKDYVNGKLLYCHPPPHIKASDFQPQHDKKLNNEKEQGATRTGKSQKVKRIENTVDKNFFNQASFYILTTWCSEKAVCLFDIKKPDLQWFSQSENVRALTKGVQSVMGYKPGNMPAAPGASVESMAGKPWKKHGNRNKKEKVRRLNKHLDA